MRKTSRSTYLIAFIIFAVGFACLVVSGLRAGSAYFVTVSEALTLTGSAPSAMKLFGVVAESPALPAATAENNSLAFTLADLDHPEQTIAVRFSGEAPHLFKPGAEVIARGLYNPDGRSLIAEELITKCPSKYEKQNRKEDL